MGGLLGGLDMHWWSDRWTTVSVVVMACQNRELEARRVDLPLLRGLPASRRCISVLDVVTIDSLVSCPNIR